MKNLEYKKKALRKIKVLRRKHCNIILKKLESALEFIQQDTLDKRKSNHPLHGNHREHKELHINGDTLLIYEIDYSTNTTYVCDIINHKELNESNLIEIITPKSHPNGGIIISKEDWEDWDW